MLLYLDPPSGVMKTDGGEMAVDEDAWYKLAVDIPSWVHRGMQLYRRCRMFNEIALPESGGVLDQQEIIVQILEEVHRAFKEHEVKKQQDAQFQVLAKMHRLEAEESGGGRVRRLG